MSLLRFEMPDMTGIDLTGQQDGQKRDVADPNLNVNERILAGVDGADVLAVADIDRNALARQEYFDNALTNVTDFDLTDADLINMLQQSRANEGVSDNLFGMASNTGDRLMASVSTDARLALTTDALQQARYGSEEVALSTTHREDGWHIYDQDQEHGIWQVGHRHDNDGVYSDIRATITGLAVAMGVQGADWDKLNQSLAQGGSMETLGQMRDTIQGLHGYASTSAGFALFGQALQSLDADMLQRQQAENPKGEFRPAIGTPEQEIKTPQMAYKPPEQRPDGPNGGTPGMSPGSPTMRV